MYQLDTVSDVYAADDPVRRKSTGKETCYVCSFIGNNSGKVSMTRCFRASFEIMFSLIVGCCERVSDWRWPAVVRAIDEYGK